MGKMMKHLFLVTKNIPPPNLSSAARNLATQTTGGYVGFGYPKTSGQLPSIIREFCRCKFPQISKPTAIYAIGAKSKPTNKSYLINKFLPAFRADLVSTMLATDSKVSTVSWITSNQGRTTRLAFFFTILNKFYVVVRQPNTL